ncbi:hypothetical protein, partial [Cronobacter sakazakii]|uniref:hypothetical protein n=1 Tax=Cronobacter sakazakii TaxID=28141 RepID=UPI001F42072C
VGPEYDVFRLYFFIFQKKERPLSFFGKCGGLAKRFFTFRSRMTSARRLPAASGKGMPAIPPSPLPLWRYGEPLSAMLC